MAEAWIPVDLPNPGQVFACMGFLEGADILLGNAEGCFEWGPSGSRFALRAAGEVNPFRAVLSFLAFADVRWRSPSPDRQERDGGETEVIPGVAASAEPKTADLPGVFRGSYGGEEREIPFGFWADGSGRFATIFKKSTNGNSSHVRTMNALKAIRQINLAEATSDPLHQAARTESLFRLDPRGFVDPLDAGFSPDNLRKGGIDVRVATYPLCELLAVIGLEHARPKEENPSHFFYAVWDRFLPPALARPVLGGSFRVGSVRTFRVYHVEAKAGGDRRMTYGEEVAG